MLQKVDIITLILVAILLFIGLMTINSASIEEQYYFVRQAIWILIGLLFMGTISIIPLKIVNRFSYQAYGFAIILLLLVLFIGSGKAGQGAERWLVLGPLRLQPSELAKIATILAVSKYLANKEADVNRFKYFAVTNGLILFPFLLIARQPDLGTALVFLSVIIPILLWAGLNWFNMFMILAPLLTVVLSFNFWAFLILMFVITAILVLSRRKPIVLVAVFLLNIVVGIATPSIWAQLRPYQQKRILTFINPEKDPKGAGYQIIQSQVAIGSGGFWGKGYKKGSQTQLRFLPAQHTDFIFSVVGEEYGFFGVFLILLVFLLLMIRLIHLASLVKDRFSSHTVLGIATILTFHILINIGMTIGMAPVTGLPLPFFSYGGSFMLANLMMIGLVLNIYRNKLGY
jgi:rod shape determining protein RodA